MVKIVTTSGSLSNKKPFEKCSSPTGDKSVFLLCTIGLSNYIQRVFSDHFSEQIWSHCFRLSRNSSVRIRFAMKWPKTPLQMPPTLLWTIRIPNRFHFSCIYAGVLMLHFCTKLCPIRVTQRFHFRRILMLHMCANQNSQKVGFTFGSFMVAFWCYIFAPGFYQR